MKGLAYGLALLFFGIVAAPVAFGNCYVLENRTNYAIKLRLSYNGTPGEGSVLAVDLMPNRHYPARGEWCWNTRADQWAKVTIETTAAYRQSWDGQLVMGNGGPASPTGRYILYPQARDEERPPGRRGSTGGNPIRGRDAFK